MSHLSTFMLGGPQMKILVRFVATTLVILSGQGRPCAASYPALAPTPRSKFTFHKTGNSTSAWSVRTASISPMREGQDARAGPRAILSRQKVRNRRPIHPRAPADEMSSRSVVRTAKIPLANQLKSLVGTQRIEPWGGSMHTRKAYATREAPRRGQR